MVDAIQQFGISKEKQHVKDFSENFKIKKFKENFVDVTLACEDKHFENTKEFFLNIN